MWTFFKPKGTAEPMTAAEIIAVEKATQAAKTEKLKALRLEREAADLCAMSSTQATGRSLTGPGGRQGGRRP
jgi:hypothetical protein